MFCCGTAVAASTAFRLSLFTAERRTATYRSSCNPNRLRSVSAHHKQWSTGSGERSNTHERELEVLLNFAAMQLTDSDDVTGHVPCLSTVSYLPHVLRFGRVLSLDA